MAALDADVPALQGCTSTRTHQAKGCPSYEDVSTPLFVSLSFSALFSSSLLSLCLPFHQLNTINYELYLPKIQTLCLHLSRATQLHKPSPLIITSASNNSTVYPWVSEWYIVSSSPRLHVFPRLRPGRDEIGICTVWCFTFLVWLTKNYGS